MPVPDALVSVASLALRGGVYALVSVHALTAADIEAATSAALTAETPMLTLPSAKDTVASPEARMRLMVDPVRISSPDQDCVDLGL